MFSPPSSSCTILGYWGLRGPGAWARLVLVSKPHLQEGQRDDTGGKGKQKSRQELRLLCPAASSLHSTRGKVTSRSESLGVCSEHTHTWSIKGGDAVAGYLLQDLKLKEPVSQHLR